MYIHIYVYIYMYANASVNVCVCVRACARVYKSKFLSCILTNADDHEETGNMRAIARCCGNIANSYMSMMQHEKAIEMYEESLAIFTTRKILIDEDLNSQVLPNNTHFKQYLVCKRFTRKANDFFEMRMLFCRIQFF